VDGGLASAGDGAEAAAGGFVNGGIASCASLATRGGVAPETVSERTCGERPSQKYPATPAARETPKIAASRAVAASRRT
jgi:hypothetical protein